MAGLSPALLIPGVPDTTMWTNLEEPRPMSWEAWRPSPHSSPGSVPEFLSDPRHGLVWDVCLPARPSASLQLPASRWSQ